MPNTHIFKIDVQAKYPEYTSLGQVCREMPSRNTVNVNVWVNA